MAFRHVNAILAVVGCSFEDILDVTMFIVDPENHFERVWEIV